jgi:hypothetical protein
MSHNSRRHTLKSSARVHTRQNTKALSRRLNRHSTRIAVEARSSPMHAAIVLLRGAFINGNGGLAISSHALVGRLPRCGGCGCAVRHNRSFQCALADFRFTIFAISPAATAQSARFWYEQDQANPQIARRCSEIMIK